MDTKQEIKKYGRGQNPGSRNGFKKGNKVWIGRKLSDEHKAKLSAGKIGDKNPAWKGDNIKYLAKHRRVEKVLGKPKKCEHCCTTTAKAYDWANRTGRYLLDLSDWVRLCRKCHIAYDKAYNKCNA